MSGFVRGSLLRTSVALAAGLMLGACGGGTLEQDEALEDSPGSHHANWIPPCDGSQTWFIRYYDSTGKEQGRRECLCTPKILNYGITSGNYEVFMGGACAEW